MKNTISLLFAFLLLTSCTDGNSNKTVSNRYVEEVVAAYKQATVELSYAGNAEEAKEAALKLQNAANRAKEIYKSDLQEFISLQHTDKELFNRINVQIMSAAGEFNKVSEAKRKEFNLKNSEENTGNTYADAVIKALSDCEKSIANATSEEEIKALLDALNAEIKKLDETHSKEKADYEAIAKEPAGKAKGIINKMTEAYTSLSHTVETKSQELKGNL